MKAETFRTIILRLHKEDSTALANAAYRELISDANALREHDPKLGQLMDLLNAELKALVLRMSEETSRYARRHYSKDGKLIRKVCVDLRCDEQAIYTCQCVKCSNPNRTPYRCCAKHTPVAGGNHRRHLGVDPTW